ncbi:unnamed protein product [Linum tenue]|uniref:Uncharacterized protein n=1 Tax=Linum tenue TaxID=586396 RepID=A0AAV0PTP4_9ROSI|nr:unnamed protein product [Linum tenue]
MNLKYEVLECKLDAHEWISRQAGDYEIKLASPGRLPGLGS